jgi:hypothetical protein
VRYQGNLCALRRVFFSSEIAAYLRTHAKNAQHVGRHAKGGNALWRFRSSEREVRAVERRKIFERVIPRFPVLKIRVRQLHCCEILGDTRLREENETFRVPIRQRTEHRPVEYRENGGRCADSNRKSQHGQKRKRGATAHGR